jgi:hypothetical protein
MKDLLMQAGFLLTFKQVKVKLGVIPRCFPGRGKLGLTLLPWHE